MEKLNKQLVIDWLNSLINQEAWEYDSADEAFRAVRNIIASGTFDIQEGKTDA